MNISYIFTYILIRNLKSYGKIIKVSIDYKNMQNLWDLVERKQFQDMLDPLRPHTYNWDFFYTSLISVQVTPFPVYPVGQGRQP